MSLKLQSSESIIHVARRHGFVYIWWWLLAFAFIFVPFFFMFWLFNHGWWGQILFFSMIAGGLFALARTLYIWNNHAAIITTHRIVDIDQRSLFEKIVTEIPYDKLDNVSGHVKGFLGTVWKFGELTIQNINGNMIIVLDNIKHPVLLQQTINEMRKKYNTKYENRFICIECEENKKGLFEVMEEKVHELEITELVKLKRQVDKKIQELLEKTK